MKEKCPLNHNIVRGASSLSPSVMRTPKTARVRVQIALEALTNANFISDTACERIKTEYMELIQNCNVVKMLEKFSRKRDSLDVFLMELCKEYKCSKDLIEFIKIILVMFHGNAEVERSFSINKNFLIENLEEDSLIAQRSVYDYIESIGGHVKNVNISKDMIRDFRSASSKRQRALDEKRESEDSEKKRRREIDEEIRVLKSRKVEVEESLDSTKFELSQCMKKLASLESEKSKKF